MGRRTSNKLRLKNRDKSRLVFDASSLYPAPNTGLNAKNCEIETGVGQSKDTNDELKNRFITNIFELKKTTTVKTKSALPETTFYCTRIKIV